MGGALMPIGGAEDKARPAAVLTRFVALAGGPRASIVVISTASSLGAEITGVYLRAFDELGAGQVVGIRPETRIEADLPALAAAVEAATGVFMTGGNQMKLSTALGGTRLGAAIRAAHERGVVVAGTSAGASAIGRHMVSFGAEGATPRHRMSQQSAGLGLLDGVVIDQHFSQRNRIGRLLSLVAASPELLGIGLDEHTAAVVGPDGVAEVVGRGVVTVVDGRQLVSNAAIAKQTAPLLVSGAVLHTLPEGSRFDLSTRTLLSGPGVPDAADAAGRAGLTTLADIPTGLRTRPRRLRAEGVHPLPLPMISDFGRRSGGESPRSSPTGGGAWPHERRGEGCAKAWATSATTSAWCSTSAPTTWGCAASRRSSIGGGTSRFAQAGTA